MNNHYAIYCIIKISRGQVNRHKTVKLRSMKNYDILEFLSKLSITEWNCVTDCRDVKSAWLNFSPSFRSIIYKVAPINRLGLSTTLKPGDF